MAVREVSGPAGAPWEPRLNGAFDKLVIESEALAGNPLGDSSRRPLYVYRSPGVVDGSATDVPVVFVLQGMGGQLDMWLEHPMLDRSGIENLDALWAASADPCPDAVVVYLDAWTSLGGSQFLNSAATGNYTDYVCGEIVPFIDHRYPVSRAKRAVAGKSSGGYGAMVLPMLRPGIFSALATHCGDALFEVCYQPDFARAAKAIRDRFGGSYETFLAEYRSRSRFDFARFGDALNVYAMAACYSPDAADPPRVRLPFELRTGRLIPEIWEQWLLFDPVRMAPKYPEALRALRHVYIDAGRHDEYNLDLAAQAYADELEALGVEHNFYLHDGGHRGTGHRYAPAIRELVTALED